MAKGAKAALIYRVGVPDGARVRRYFRTHFPPDNTKLPGGEAAMRF